jgi:hypothetical protein
MNKNMLSSHLTTVLKKDPYFALILMAAIKIDEDIEKGLIPPEFGKIENLERLFTNPLFFKQIYDYKENLSLEANTTKYDMVRLPLFLKHILIGMIKSVHFRESIENSK